MKLEETLTKENFWNDTMAKYPKATKVFCEWVDEYKKAVGWDLLFGANEVLVGCKKVNGFKYHDIPHAMQQDIWIEFIEQTLHHYYEQPEYEYSNDLREDIYTVFGELEGLMSI